ncbi:oligosaccharide flippase family protein [Leptolyngbya sp. FACHB-261]|nr:oligosaccharide flippase family protein [Leptolyngbya sp. FACHB-261]
MLINRLVQSLTTFALVAAIARLLGPYELGQYLLAFGYYYIFMSIASQGLKVLFTRELSRNLEEVQLYLINGTLLQLFASLISYGILVITVFLLPYNSDTSTACYILGLMVVPFSLSNVTEAIFQAQERMYLITLSTVPVYILRLLVIIWIMQQGYTINLVSAILVLSEIFILVLQWGLLIQKINLERQINWSFMRRSIKAARTFFAIEAIAVLKDRMQLLILSLIGGEIVVGLYGAVMQLMQPFEIIAHSLALAIFPRMNKIVAAEPEKLRDLVEGVIEILLSVALPLIIGLFFLGRDLLVFVYGNPSFADADTALKIVALALVASSLMKPLSLALVASGFERINLREVSVTTSIGGLISIVLVTAYQLTGAAITALLMQLIACGQYVYPVHRRLFPIRFWHVLRYPMLASIWTLCVFLILQRITQDLLITMLTATSLYCLLIMTLSIYAFGGLNAVKAKLRRSL